MKKSVKNIMIFNQLTKSLSLLVWLKNTHSVKLLLLFFTQLFISINIYAQAGECDATVPVFYVDLSNDASGSWEMENVTRDGSCCSYSHPPLSCVKFILTLNSGARSIIFNVTDGALPSNLEWQLMNPDGDYCDPTVYPANVPVCLNGVGPHTIVFCKPGGNNNTYSITSVPSSVLEIDSIFNGCSYVLDAGSDWSTFFWNTGDTTQTISAQDSGWYWVETSNINCMSKRDSVYFGYIPPISIGNDTSICFGQNITLSPGNSYTFYEWSTGVSGSDASSITVGGGTYSVTVTDATGCISNSSIRIIEGANMEVNIITSNVKCIGEQTGSLNLTISGGIQPYSYLWSNGFTSEDINNLFVGNYSVTVTDYIGCQIDTSVVVSEPIAPITVSSLVSDASCFESSNGIIDISVSGDVSPYAFIWDNGAITEDISSLLAGIYSVTITSANLCSQVFTDTVFRPSNVLLAYIVGNSAKCKGSFDGSTSTTVIGGTPPYTYLWSNGQITQDISDISAGNYLLTVTDANLCTTISSVNIGEPSASISVSATATEPLCSGAYDGSIDLIVSGGTPDYSFIWNTSQISEDLLGVSAGTYFVTVSEVNNCKDSVSIVLGEPNTIDISSTIIDIECFGDSNGSIDVSVLGGTPDYSYFWNNGSTNQDLNNIQSDTYDLTVADAHYCTQKSSINVSTPDELLYQIFATSVSCKGGNDGAINLTPIGGTAPYTFLWNTGATSEDLSNLSIGNFSVVITDANACSTSAEIVVTEPANDLSVIVIGTNLDCNGIPTGGTQISVNGGTPSYSYLWSNGYTNADLTNLLAGTYSLTVTDSKSCTANASVTLTEPSAITELTSINNPTCGHADGSISVSVSGGTPGYSYLWSNGITVNSLSNIDAGAYSLTITDTENCIKVVNANVDDVNSPTITTQSVADVICYGSANGSIAVSVSGGTSPYTYQWSNGGTLNSISSLSGGTYTVVVVDNLGCTSSQSIDVYEPSEINTILVKQNVNCNAGSDGNINLIVEGGTSPYSFNWNNGASTEDLINIVAGSYIVTITDANGCIASDNISVTQPANALSASANITAVVCNGDENGKIDLSVNFGTPTYGYQWSSGQQSQDIDNLQAGTYDVTITDANNCFISHTYTVSEPQVLSASIVGTDVLCKGVPTGTATLTVTGGNIGAKTYVWNYGQVTQNLTNIGEGTYEVTVTDSKSCVTTASVTISEPSALSATITKTNIKCNGQANGTANLEVSGGTPPYSYLWSNGATTQDLSNIGAGTYTVTVTDDNNCTVTSSVSISSPSVISVSGTSNTVSCFGGNDGEALLTVNGGTSPYTYQWNLGQTSEDLTNLQAGIYLVTIYDSKLCSKTYTVTVNEPSPISINSVISDVTCLNGSNGAINLTISGGTGTYTYVWNTGATSQNITGLSDGIYEVTVSDANLCTNSSAFTIEQPSTSITIGLDAYNLKCRVGADGEINATISGGTPPYTYLWSNGTTTQDLTNLSIGTYTLTVTDANGCTKSSSTTLTQPNTLLTLATTQTDILCNSASTGEVNLTVTDGVPPYTYLWSNGLVSEDVANLPVGTYTVSVTDANSCIKSSSVTLIEPSAVTITDVSTNATCLTPNGSSTLTVTGGVAPYTYLWSTGSTSNSITNVTSGAYSVTVTDSHACETDYSADVNDATGPNVQISYKSDVTCHGDADGTATVYVISGLAPYTYLWSGGSTTTIQSNLSGGYQTVRVTDVNGCVASQSVYINEPEQLVVTNYTPNICDIAELGYIDLSVTGGIQNYRYEWSNGSTSQDLIDIPSGNYVVTVTDVNACQVIQSIDVDAPAITLSSSVVGTNVQCKNASDGVANISVVGGALPYTYLWNFGQITEDLNNITAGFYEVTVSDAIGCKSISSITITEPSLIIKNTVRTNVTCNGLSNGSIDLTSSGGTAPHTFLWSNGETTEDILNILAGSYTVTITDANSCSTTISATVSEPTELTATILGTNVKCNGDNSGTVSVVASGGTPLYSYIWSNGSTQSSQTNVTSNTYLVTVSDANLCSVNKSLIITQPNVLTTSIVSSNVSCYGDVSGAITLTVGGGVQDYSYIWNFGQTSSTLPDVQAGDYQVTVTDANLCTKTDSVTITEPISALSSTLAITNVSCNTGTDGEINLTVSGGTIPYTYNWSLGSSNQDLSALTAASYDVTITDNNGCITTNSAIVTQPNALSITDVKTNVSCNGGNDGAITISVSGGTPSYSYNWGGGVTTQNRSSLVAGNYTVTVTDSKLCTFSKSFTISEPSTIQITVDSVNVDCNGNYNGSIDITASGGTPTYSYIWNNGTTVADLNSLSGGIFKVTVTDKNGCFAIEDVVIEEPDELSVIAIIENVNCRGNATGDIQLLVSGGVAAYNFAWSSGQTVDSIVNVVAGNYICTVTDDNSCSVTVNSTITQPSASLAIVPTWNNVSCYDGADGSINLIITGGVLAYSYLWSNGITSKNLSNISAGSYTITVTDANSCIVSTSVTITQPLALSSSILPSNVSCYGDNTGLADLEVFGGTTPYSYAWSNGQIGLDDLNGVAAGIFFVTITDNKLCQLIDTVEITQPISALQNAISGTNASCYGFSDGSAQVVSIGGTSPYTYLWNYGQVTSIINGISAGSFSVTVTDSLSCKTISTVNITQPLALSANIIVSPVNCNGENTGSANLTVTGGTQPYSYSWSNFTSNEDISNVIAGNYQITITDDKMCTLIASTTVTEPALLVASINGDDVNCYGGTSGVADLTTIGGTPSYTYLWSSGQTNPDISGLVAGNYSVTVSDAKNCVTSASVNILEPNAPLNITYSSVNASCFSSATGSVNINVSGGTTPYTYLWNYGQTTQDLNNIVSANYSITVTDHNSCIETQDIGIYQPTELTGSITQTKVKCKGESTGSLDLTVSGGITPYTYNWSNSGTTQDISNLLAGLYAVTVTDANGCTKILSKTVTEPSGILTIVMNPSNVNCYDGNDGAVNLTVSGGTAPYSYLWSNGLTSEDLLNVTNGTYDITVTDVNSCITSGSITITEPTPLSLIPSQTNSTCGIADGTATVSVSGGTVGAGYTYLWSNGANTPSVINVSSGVYTVTVTDANSCSDNISIAVNDEGAPIANIIGLQDVTCNGMNDVTASGGTGSYVYEWSNGVSTTTASNLDGGIYYASVTDDNHCLSIATVSIYEPEQLLGSITPINVKCKGNATGAANLLVQGGTTPYQFAWSSGQISEDISSIVAGFYTATITDLNSCQTMASVVISEPAQVLSASISKTDAQCNGSSDGFVDLAVAGGTPAYSYLWNYGQVSQDLSGVEAGFYEVTITDNNACKTTASTIVNQASEIISSIVITNSTCNNANNGAADLSVSGGTLPYTYLWNTGDITQDLVSIDAGVYIVTITDGHLCTQIETATITEPTGLAYTISGQNVKCYGESTGSISLQVLGGTMPYTYLWNSGSTNEDLSNIPAGNYQVLITDAKNCSANTSILISQPIASLVTGITGNNVTCYEGTNGSINLSVGGGTTPYSYQWNYGQITQDLNNIQAGTYEVTITDANNCTASTSKIIIEPSEITMTPSQTSSTCGIANGIAQIAVSGGVAPYTYLWNNLKTTSMIDSLVANAYSVTVTDDNGCTNQITINVNDFGAPSASLTYSNVSCYGAADGEILLNLSGGTSPFSYEWNNTYNTSNITNLSGGVYIVTVTDGNNCVATATAEIYEPDELNLSSSSVNVMCKNESDGEINLDVIGGTPGAGYVYNWSNGQHSQDLTGLSGGTYTVTVIDANICFKTYSVTINEPDDTLSSSFVANHVSCYGMTNGVANLSVNGGTPNYTYQWNHGASSEDVSNLGAGNYEVTILDANGCAETNSITIIQPTVLSSTVTTDDVNCKNENDGSATLTVNGGTSPYSYFWSNGDISNNPQNLTANEYLLTVTDANLCKLYSSITISEPDDALSLISLKTDVNCYGDSSGLINVSVSGGTPTYSYQWSNGITSEDVANIPAGTYSLTITDANACQTILNNIAVTQPTHALSIAFAPEDVNCYGDYTGTINLSVSGGTPSYEYFWNSGQINQDLSNIPAGLYSVTVTDNNDCRISGDITISQPANLVANVSKTNVTCFGESNGNLNLTVSGGVTPYTYAWNYGQTTEDISMTDAGFYSVTVSDVNSCIFVVSSVVNEPQPIQVSFNSSDVSCRGGNDGYIDLNILGGTPNYNYSWSNGDFTEDLSDITAGNYIVTISDNNFCTEIESIEIYEPSTSIVASISGTNVSCNGENDGVAIVAVIGGTGSYQYHWNFGYNTPSITGLVEGLYEVTVSDAHNCIDTVSIQIIEPASLVLLPSKTNSTCGQSNGTASVDVIGGTPPYSYYWSSGEIVDSIANKPAGAYSVTVVDAHSCSNFIIISVNDLGAPASEISSFTNPSCYGYNNGTATVSAVGGTGNYTYIWSTGATQITANNLSAGPYIVTVSDENHCISSSSVIIEQPDSISISFVTTDVLCNGGSDGSVNMTVSGGTPNYFYQWNYGQTTQDLVNVGNGLYETTVTDSKSCSATASVQVNEPSQQIVINESHVNVSCYDYSNGSINISVSGGTSPYTYLWNFGQFTQDLNNIESGIYEITVTDARTCTETKLISITQPTQISISSIAQNVSCNSMNDGSIDITVSGGTPSYSFEWINGDGFEDISGLSEGNYTLTVTDSKSCTATEIVTISQPDSLFANINYENVNCKSGNDGSAYVIVSGGTPEYEYNWSNGSTTEDISNLPAGTFYLTVSDANNCEAIAEVDVDEPANNLTITYYQSNVSCYGGYDGYIDLNVSGGTPNYTYVWNYGQTTQDIVDLNARIYQVTVTDANGCIETENITLNQPAQIIITPISSMSMCNDSTGMATASTVGGTGAYSYLWSTGSTNDSIINIPSEAYSLTITDENSCSQSITINVNDLGAPDLSVTYDDVTCYGDADGSIDLSTSGGGTPPFTYLWSNNEITQDISNLSGGNYAVTLTDLNNCRAFINQDIFEPNQLISEIFSTDVNCHNGSDGLINLVVTGGTGVGSYTFDWSNGASSEDLFNIQAGTYNVTITDANNCSITDDVEIIEPENPLTITETHENITCFGYNNGSINITVSGGTPNYMYLWNYGQTSQDLSALSPYNYEVTVTDEQGCTASQVIEILQPNSINIAYIPTHVNCKGGNNGAINVSASGGTNPYSYLWTYGQITEDIDSLTADIYSITVTDANLCSSNTNITITEPVSPLYSQISGSHVLCKGENNGSSYIVIAGGTTPYSYLWNTGSTSSSISNLYAGIYTVEASDANGCDITNQFTVTEPDSLLLSSSFENVNCFGNRDASINLSVIGGTQPYLYAWSPGNITQDLSEIGSGIYVVTVTDAHLCSEIEMITITQPDKLISTLTASDVKCFGDNNGDVDLTVIGGVLDYAYAWNYGQNTQDLSNLTAGNYVVTITDAHNCNLISSVNVFEPEALQISAQINDVSCNGDDDGDVILTVSGGTPTYSYLWSNGTLSRDLINVEVGEYNVHVADLNGCFLDSSFIINEPDTLEAYVLASMDANYNGDCDGYVTIGVHGGTPSYTYSWTNGMSGATQAALCAGNYYINVSDANGCITTVFHQVGLLKPPPNASFIMTEDDCPPLPVQFTNNSIFATSYLWDFGDGTTDTVKNPLHVYENSGVYVITLTAYGESGQDDTYGVITVYPEPSAYFTVQPTTVTALETPIHCYNNSQGGTTYLWNFGDGTISTEAEPIHYFEEEGTFDILFEVYTEHGCVDSMRIEDAVTVSSSCEMIFPDAFIPNQDGPIGGNWENEDYYSNRIFHPVSRKIDEYHLEIYTRWGEKIFDSEDVMIGWDGYFKGKIAQQDVYVYKARWKCSNGKEYVKAGDITLYH